MKRNLSIFVIASFITMLIFNASVFSSCEDEFEKVSIQKVIQYLQVLAGMQGEIPDPPDKEPLVSVIGTGSVTGVYYPT
ncbi:secreted protein, partial [Candidatus Magnetomorum sp. HK-1]